MFTLDLCKDLANIPDWGCGAYNKGRQSTRPCSFNKNNKTFYTSPHRFALDKPMNPYRPFKNNQ